MRALEFDSSAFEDLAWWIEQDRAQALPIIRLVRDVQRDPFSGLGKPDDQACAAAERLYKEATEDDVPKLLTLLTDDEAFLREADAWPLSGLGQVSLLKDLLVAYQRSLEEGLDNDGFSAALIDLVELKRQESAAELHLLAFDSSAHVRENASWLLEFCSGE